MLLWLTCACDGRARQERPGIPPQTILLVSVDGLRADHVSFWNAPGLTTWIESDAQTRASGRALAIDDLAEEGVAFARAFSPATTANAALASLHTGRAPWVSGVLGDENLPQHETTLAEALASEGFSTNAFVARADGAMSPGLAQGFQQWEVFPDDLSVVRRALAWCSARDSSDGQLCFLWLHLEGPCVPLHSLGGDGQGSATATAAEIQSEYQAQIGRTNQLLRGLLDYYQYSGNPAEAWSRTLLVFVGLGGESLPGEFGEHGGGRAIPSEMSMHVPLFLRHPDSLTGRRIFADLVGLEDVLPTLLEWFSFSVPAEIQGHSLLSLTDEWRRRDFPARELVSVGRPAAGLTPAWSLRTPEERLLVVASSDPSAPNLFWHDLRSGAAKTLYASSDRPHDVERVQRRWEDLWKQLPLVPAVAREPWLR